MRSPNPRNRRLPVGSLAGTSCGSTENDLRTYCKCRKSRPSCCLMIAYRTYRACSRLHLDVPRRGSTRSTARGVGKARSCGVIAQTGGTCSALTASRQASSPRRDLFSQQRASARLSRFALSCRHCSERLHASRCSNRSLRSTLQCSEPLRQPCDILYSSTASSAK